IGRLTRYVCGSGALTTTGLDLRHPECRNYTATAEEFRAAGIEQPELLKFYSFRRWDRPGEAKMQAIDIARPDEPYTIVNTAETLRYCRATDIGDDLTAYGLVELFLVGWSEAERRMRSWFWANAENFAPRIDVMPLGETTAIPPLPDYEMPPRRGSLDAHLVA